MHHPLKPVPSDGHSPNSNLQKVSKKKPFFYAGFNNPSKARKTSCFAVHHRQPNHLIPPEPTRHSTTPYTGFSLHSQAMEGLLQTVVHATWGHFFFQRNCNRAPKHGGGPWWQDIWGNKCSPICGFATYHKEIRNRKEQKKQECASTFSQQKIYFHPGKKNGSSVSRKPKKKTVTNLHTKMLRQLRRSVMVRHPLSWKGMRDVSIHWSIDAVPNCLRSPGSFLQAMQVSLRVDDDEDFG